MNKKVIIVTTIILAGLIGFMVYTFKIILEKDPVVLQGEVKAKEINIASKVPGRVESIGVDRGQSVNEGDFIFSISSPEVNAKMAEAVAARSAAEAQNQKAKNGAQIEDITAAHSVFVKAEAAATFAETSYNRIKNLYEKDVVPRQQLDEIETKMKAAKENSRAAKAVWEKAKKGAREEDKAAAKALVARADAAISQVQAYVDETRINAISKGEVASINIQPGELVSTGFPVVSLVDLDDVWLTFYIREDYLKDFKVGNTFQAHIPAIGNDLYEFKVSYLSDAADFARWNATKTSGEFDLKSFEMEARPVNAIDGLRPGMTAIITLPAEQ